MASRRVPTSAQARAAMERLRELWAEWPEDVPRPAAMELGPVRVEWGYPAAESERRETDKWQGRPLGGGG